MKTLNEIADTVHANAKAKGFHPLDQPIEVFIAQQLNNLHCEVSELWESVRDGSFNEPCDKDIGLTCAEEEYADIVIRCLDQCRRLGIDIQRAIEVRHAYNTTRPHLHGKKC